MMGWTQGSVRVGGTALLLLAGASLSIVRAAGGPTEATTPPRHAAPFDHPPLAPPLRMTGSFCEARSSHFHAGVDLSTGERVGMPVFAPRAGQIVRVRASGVGYGRSLYLRDEQGWLLVLGHLDAFDEPIASYVAAVQDSSGQYEQDLWPDSTRFRVRAGQRLGWSGRSGTGPPHLHFEARRGDMAYNPQLAGLVVRDTVPPAILRLVLEPLDDSSSVEGRSAPREVTWGGGRGARVAARGRLRVLVEAVDARANGRLSMAPWRTTLSAGGDWVSIAHDSVSWATGMSEVDYVYDRGRTTDRGSTTRRLWAPAGFRPSGFTSSAPFEAEAGTITRRDGMAPLDLEVTAMDAAGNATRRSVVVTVGPRAIDDPEPAGHAAPVPRLRLGANVDLESIGGRRVRVSLAGEGWRGHVLERAGFGSDSARASGNAAILSLTGAGDGALSLVTRGAGGTRSALATGVRIAWLVDGARDSLGALSWSAPAGATFEPGVLALEDLGTPGATAHLAPVASAYALHPSGLPLRSSIRVSLAPPPGATGADPQLGVYLERGDGWEFQRSERDPASGRLTIETRRLGRFALFRDARAPRIQKRRPPVGAASGAYPRWALEARLDDDGSGIDPRASAFEVGGRRVPSEWDAEERVLRWRPLDRPNAGSHPYRVVAVDRAGNTARAEGSFVLK